MGLVDNVHVDGMDECMYIILYRWSEGWLPEYRSSRAAVVIVLGSSKD